MTTIAPIPGFVPVKSVRLGWRRFTNIAVQTSSSMFVQMRDGKPVGFGIEPLGDVMVASDGTVTRLIDGGRGQLDRVRVALAAAGAGAVAAAAAAGAVLLSRRSR